LLEYAPVTRSFSVGYLTSFEFFDLFSSVVVSDSFAYFFTTFISLLVIDHPLAAMDIMV
jgi:hypothetical protein